MGSFYLLAFFLVLSEVSAEVISNSCADQSKVLCSLRKAECATQEQLRILCPDTCGQCSGTPVKPKVYKLSYFDAMLRGEQIRWILEQADANWIDDRISFADWPAVKPKTLTGQLPYFEVEGTVFAQSGAIALYVGREFGLAGSSNLETAEVHMIWDMVQEAFNALVPFLAQPGIDPVVQANAIKNFNEKALPRLIKFLENRLRSGDEWLVGNKLTLADIVTASLIDNLTGVARDQVKASKLVNAVYDRVMALPRIQAWLAKRPKSVL